METMAASTVFQIADERENASAILTRSAAHVVTNPSGALYPSLTKKRTGRSSTWTSVLMLLVSMSVRVQGFTSSSSFVSSGSKMPMPKFGPLHQQSRTRRPASTLSMHMGHSHSHHHHHGHSDHATPKFSAKALLASPQFRRKLALITFAALATLLPPLIARRTHTLGKADYTAFAVTSLMLSSVDTIRSQVKYLLQKVQNLKSGFVKHWGQSDAPSVGTAVSPSVLASRQADRVTLIGVLLNVLLSAGKFVVGVTCHSSALIADAGHSLSDLFSDFVTLYAVQVARLPADDDHPYGHGKFEAVGSLFLALTLLGTGLSIGAMANRELLHQWALHKASSTAKTAAAAVQLPTPPALLMAAISIGSKEWLFRITKAVGERIRSQIVVANAWHHRSDAYSSVLALASIGLAMAVPGLQWADPAAGLLVAGTIGMTGLDILGASIRQLTDSSDAELEQIVKKELLQEQDGDVRHITSIMARQIGSNAHVDVHCRTSPDLTPSALQAVEGRLASRVRNAILNTSEDDVGHDGHDHSHDHAHKSVAEPTSSPSTGDAPIDFDVHVNVRAQPELSQSLSCPLLQKDLPSAALVQDRVRELALLDHVPLHRVRVHYFEDEMSPRVLVEVVVSATNYDQVKLGNFHSHLLNQDSIDEAVILVDALEVLPPPMPTPPIVLGLTPGGLPWQSHPGHAPLPP